MLHVPSHNHRGTLCSFDVEPTPGVAEFPSPLPEGRADLCPDCARMWHVCDREAHRAASRSRDRSHWDRILELRQPPRETT